MSNFSVLIVEDDYILAQMAKMQIAQEGYEVIGPVDSIDKAIESCREITPAVIIMDIQLKGEPDGIDGAKMISEACNCSIPIIYMTGNSDMSTKSKARDTTGCEEFLVKPVEQEALLKAIKKIFDRTQE